MLKAIGFRPNPDPHTQLLGGNWISAGWPHLRGQVG